MTNATVVIVDGFPVLNPDFSWSAFLPPVTVYELDIAKYMLVGTSLIFVWDILNNIRNDCSLVAKHTRLQLPKFIYFFSRLISLASVVFATIFQTLPISNCFHSGKVMAVLIAMGVPSTSLLFFFRARAIFNYNPLAVTFFAVLWLAVLGGSWTLVPGIVGSHIGPTPYCIIKAAQPYSAAVTIVPLIYDVVVFFAISWRLWQNSWATRTMKNGIRTMVFGKYLPSFSKSLLQDGQVYFLTTVICGFLNVAIYAHLVLPSTVYYRMMFVVPNTALMNIMASRVHRWTALQRPRSGEDQGPSSSKFNPTALVTYPNLGEGRPGVRDGVNGQDGFRQPEFNASLRINPSQAVGSMI